MLPAALRRWLRRPKRSDPRLLSQFFFADERVTQVVAEINGLDAELDPQQYLVLLNQLHLSQAHLLAILERIMEECIPTQRHSRDYLVKFPEELLVDNLGNHMLFAAEVSPGMLSRGGRWGRAPRGWGAMGASQGGTPHCGLTQGVGAVLPQALAPDGPRSRQCLLAGTFLEVEEADGAQLRPQARNLLCSLELVRTVLREQSLSQPGSYPEPVRAVLVQFDRLFAEFELRWGPGLGCWGGRGGVPGLEQPHGVPGSPATCPRWWR
ncbi:lateral signaling target protein 2 homolog isoform 1-T1 [Alca torda]